MKRQKTLSLALLLAVIVIAFFLRSFLAPSTISEPEVPQESALTSKEEVSAYIRMHGALPPNFLTKKEAQELGWDASRGNLHEVAPGMSIGGDRFYNREGLLPEKEGRRYYECDISYNGGKRGPERLVYSNDGLIFYTGDHYASFEPID